MKEKTYDLMIIGAGPVGLMCACLAHQSGLSYKIIDKSDGPLKVGRADALNARTLQLLELAKLFEDIYPLGKKCNTSSVWEKGRFTSRQSHWWENLEGCFHKHFLMLGQSHLENLLDQKLKDLKTPVQRKTTVRDISLQENYCKTLLSNGETINSAFVIGADGSRSFVRNHFKVGFEITKPQITWAVIDAEIETSFTKVPEIIVFQVKTSDVAWIPREGLIDRFYIRMDRSEFSIEECLEKINTAMAPHSIRLKRLEWFSQFSVKESVAESFNIKDRVFLAGDACHIHSVNGGQGLNTGLADTFNLIWKLAHKIKFHSEQVLLSSYETERKPVALSVIETSGQLVRTTKYSSSGTHAQDYVDIVEKKAGHITGMGIHYGHGRDSLIGHRLHDMNVYHGEKKMRLYQLLNYSHSTYLNFSSEPIKTTSSKTNKIITIGSSRKDQGYWTNEKTYQNKVLLVRPDAYIVQVQS